MASRADGPIGRVSRKQAGPSRARGKAGFRRLEAVLEAANLVVQAVATENDIGRDAFVDLVDGTDVTGGVICLQIKSGRASHFGRGTWVIPGRPSDFTLWRESTVPFFGVVHDEVTDALRWVNLSEAAKLAQDDYLSTVVRGPFGKDCVPVPEANRLDVDLNPFMEAASRALSGDPGVPVAALLSEDVARVASGISDSFALGRHDPNALLLLGSLLHRLPRSNRRHAIGALAMASSHPDVFWTKENWIPELTRSDIRKRVNWTKLDLSALLGEIDDAGIDRGTFGQTVFHVLTLDRQVKDKLFQFALSREESDYSRLMAAVILLYLAANSASAVLDRLFEADIFLHSSEGLFPARRSFAEIDNVRLLIDSVEEFGCVFLF